jgi:hypothetical protein
VSGTPVVLVTRLGRLPVYRVTLKPTAWTVLGPSLGLGCGVSGWLRVGRSAADRKAARELARFTAGR